MNAGVASLTSCKFTTTVTVPVKAGAPPSVALMTIVNDGVVSMSSAAWEFTVISPEEDPIAKAELVFPLLMEYVMSLLGEELSASVQPKLIARLVLSTVFSASDLVNSWDEQVGVLSLTSVTVIVRVPIP